MADLTRTMVTTAVSERVPLLDDPWVAQKSVYVLEFELGAPVISFAAAGLTGSVTVGGTCR